MPEGRATVPRGEMVQFGGEPGLLCDVPGGPSSTRLYRDCTSLVEPWRPAGHIFHRISAAPETLSALIRAPFDRCYGTSPYGRLQRRPDSAKTRHTACGSCRAICKSRQGGDWRCVTEYRLEPIEQLFSIDMSRRSAS